MSLLSHSKFPINYPKKTGVTLSTILNQHISGHKPAHIVAYNLRCSVVVAACFALAFIWFPDSSQTEATDILFPARHYGHAKLTSPPPTVPTPKKKPR
jgi:hypothetical protein